MDKGRVFWRLMAVVWGMVAATMASVVLPDMLVALCVVLGFDMRRPPVREPEPVVMVEARKVGKARGLSRRKPSGHVEYVDRLVLNYCFDLTYHCTGYTRFSDPGDPYKRTYSSVNFLPGSKRPDLYDPLKPFRREWTLVRDTDYSVAVPYKWRHLFEERIEMPSGYWYHRYRIWCEGYTPQGVYAVPRDRITKRDRFDFLFTSTKRGRTPTQRAYDFTSKAKRFEVWRLDWVKVPKGSMERVTK